MPLNHAGYRLDNADKRIIRALREDGRLPWVQLGAAVNLSPSACQRRVEAMVAAGVIERFTIDLDPVAVGASIHALIQIKVERQDVATAEAFRKRIASYPEVSGFYKLSGNIDYLAHVHVADIRALSDFLDRKVLALPGVVDASSAIVLDDLPVRYRPV